MEAWWSQEFLAADCVCARGGLEHYTTQKAKVVLPPSPHAALPKALQQFAEPCYTKQQGWRPRDRRPFRPWHPQLNWLLGDRLLVWLLLVALPAITIYAIGHLLGWW